MHWQTRTVHVTRCIAVKPAGWLGPNPPYLQSLPVLICQLNLAVIGEQVLCEP